MEETVNVHKCDIANNCSVQTNGLNLSVIIFHQIISDCYVYLLEGECQQRHKEFMQEALSTDNFKKKKHSVSREQGDMQMGLLKIKWLFIYCSKYEISCWQCITNHDLIWFGVSLTSPVLVQISLPYAWACYPFSGIYLDTERNIISELSEHTAKRGQLRDNLELGGILKAGLIFFVVKKTGEQWNKHVQWWWERGLKLKCLPCQIKVQIFNM